MARLIDYQTAVDRYYTEFEKQDICDGAQDRDWLKQCFDEAPTIDPKSLRPEGHVLDNGNPICGPCSECGENMNRKSNYCPNCGARMEETELMT